MSTSISAKPKFSSSLRPPVQTWAHTVGASSCTSTRQNAPPGTDHYLPRRLNRLGELRRVECVILGSLFRLVRSCSSNFAQRSFPSDRCRYCGPQPSPANNSRFVETHASLPRGNDQRFPSSPESLQLRCGWRSRIV